MGVFIWLHYNVPLLKNGIKGEIVTWNMKEITAENVKFKEMAEIIFRTPQLDLLEEEELIFLYAHNQNKKKSGMRKVQMRQ